MEQNTTAQSIVFRLAVTTAGEGEEPMVAVRVTADGKEVKLPFALVLGGLQLSQVGDNPAVRASIASSTLELAQAIALGVIKQAQASTEVLSEE